MYFEIKVCLNSLIFRNSLRFYSHKSTDNLHKFDIGKSVGQDSMVKGPDYIKKNTSPCLQNSKSRYIGWR